MAVIPPAAVMSRVDVIPIGCWLFEKSNYLCIGIVTGNSERVDNPLETISIRAPLKSRSLGDFYFLFMRIPGSVMQYCMYSPVFFCLPTVSLVESCIRMMIWENIF